MPNPAPLRVLVTGATGFLGRALCLRLARDGHALVAWVRDPARARAQLGAEVELLAIAAGRAALVRELERCDAVVHLAGESLFGGRWTPARKRALQESRIDLSRELSHAIRSCARPPRVLVAASAVGFYGDRGDEPLDEDSPGGTGFQAELCRGWEAACDGARAAGVRVVHLRIGVVLGPEGGALAKMLPAFRLGLGGPIGRGRQWLSWIHLEDLCELAVAALGDDRWRGAIDATAPEPVTQSGFARALGRALGRPAFVPAPAFLLRAALGEAADVLLASQRVLPRKAEAQGFRFRFPTIERALDDLFGTGAARGAPAGPRIRRLGRACELPHSAYLRARRPSFELRHACHLPAPLEEVFAFFSRAENLGAITPPAMAFEIRSPLPLGMRAGARIDYSIRLGPLPLAWRTEIERWQPGESFVDAQLAGPYRSWWHEHRFVREGEGTRMEDRVLYAPPLRFIGRLANGLLVAPRLRAIFAYRSRSIALRFGSAGRGDPGATGVPAAARGRPVAAV